MAAIVGLQMGAFGVVLETVLSGISSLPFSTFVAMMQPIHLAIGIVEGLVTAAVVSFVYRARPEIMQRSLEPRPICSHPLRNIAVTFLAVAMVSGGIVSWFASKKPDGLEWAITRLTGQAELKGPEQGLHAALASLQAKIAFLPDYSFKKAAGAEREKKTTDKNWPAGTGNHPGTSISGLVGGLTTLGLALLIGRVLKKRKNTPS